MSCDLLPSERPRGLHHQGSVLDILHLGWDLLIAHPPCTHLAVSGARWFRDKRREQDEALHFVRALMAAPIPRICIENPVSVISSRIRRPDQIVQPWQFGHGETEDGRDSSMPGGTPKVACTSFTRAAFSSRAERTAGKNSPSSRTDCAMACSLPSPANAREALTTSSR